VFQTVINITVKLFLNYTIARHNIFSHVFDNICLEIDFAYSTNSESFFLAIDQLNAQILVL